VSRLTIAGPVEIRRKIDEISYLLCMTAITDRNLNAAFGPLQLDPRLSQLGDKAVIVTNVTEFQKRLERDDFRRVYSLNS